MDRLFDEAARILASPLSRRQAFGRLWKVAAGVLLAGAVAAPASALSCKSDKDCATTNQKCCKMGSTGFCAPTNNVCCGNTSCQSPQCCAKKTQTCTASTQFC
jgi:hypothetical protein